METFKENLLKKFGKEGLGRIEQAKIGIAGLGGLGSNCAMNLVRSGFKKLTLVDFDTVTQANLDRQFYFQDQVGQPKPDALKINLSRINPNLEIRAQGLKLERNNIKEIFADCDVVVECLDHAQAKTMFVEELLGSGKFIVAVSGLGGVGSSDEIKVHRLKNNLVLIGDLRSDIQDKPALSPRVNIAAGKQADAVLEHVLSGN